ncbi:MAG TPA: RES family NAD+ phosphorylase [Candidatus Dormibacteraeota bacterium]|nr:RES family NAD+ phosphorylase [Candidatus Dormibacteraeota bacterium]
MTVFRVFPFDPSAADRAPGGALFVPPGGRGRIDSVAPRAYTVLYVGSTPECAVAECFGAFDVWDRIVVEAKPATPLLPKSRFALASYALPSALDVRNLDDAAALLAEGLIPSRVVTRDRSVTQAWASRIHARGSYAGLAWWSYYEPSWQSVGIWGHERLRLASSPRVLHVADEAVRSSAKIIRRRIAA